MAYYPKKPKLTAIELNNQIADRVGIPTEWIKRVLDCYTEVTKEALLANVEVPFGDVGYFSWKQIVARPNVSTWDYQTKTHTEPHDLDGFQKTLLRVNKAWATELKIKTTYHVGEEPPDYLDGIDENEPIKLRRKHGAVIRSVSQFDLNGEHIADYKNASEAARAIEAPRSNGITECLRGERKSAYGYIWKYKEDEDENEQSTD